MTEQEQLVKEAKEIVNKIKELTRIKTIDEIRDFLAIAYDLAEEEYNGTYRVIKLRDKCALELYERDTLITRIDVPCDIKIDEVREYILSKRVEIFLKVFYYLVKELKDAEDMQLWEKLEELERQANAIENKIDECCDP